MNSKSKILVVDDDPVTRCMLADMLRMEGYQVVVELEDGSQVIDMVNEQHFDIILLDISMPGKDGLTLTRELRATHEILGIILVTGKGEDIDKIIGIEVGADDYLVKPVKLRELQARVKNLLRRVTREKAQSNLKMKAAQVLNIGTFELDLNRQQLLCAGGESQDLTHGEFEILNLLTRNSGMVLSRERLLKVVSQREWGPDDRTVDVLIGRLRKKIEADVKRPQHLITVHGAGYKLIA